MNSMKNIFPPCALACIFVSVFPRILFFPLRVGGVLSVSSCRVSLRADGFGRAERQGTGVALRIIIQDARK